MLSSFSWRTKIQTEMFWLMSELWIAGKFSNYLSWKYWTWHTTLYINKLNKSAPLKVSAISTEIPRPLSLSPPIVLHSGRHGACLTPVTPTDLGWRSQPTSWLPSSTPLDQIPGARRGLVWSHSWQTSEPSSPSACAGCLALATGW